MANMQLTAFVSSIHESIGPFRANHPITTPSIYRLRWKRANALKRLAHMRYSVRSICAGIEYAACLYRDSPRAKQGLSQGR